jgi:[ribosomal protein S18]-alanine N-acetyltransferase
MTNFKILSYRQLPATFHEYDPSAPVVAEALAAAIRGAGPHLQAEHVGSSAVPGCGGKGVIDLLVTYPPGQLAAAKQALMELGYQPQPQRDPFPEVRPMRVAGVEFRGAWYNVHAHVIAADSPEAAELRQFRDRLRSDPVLRAAYEAEKRRILAAGVADSTEYAIRKGEFVARELAGVTPAPLPQFHFVPMTAEYARTIAGWHYPGEYSFYDMDQDPAEKPEILEQANWPGRYFAVLDGGDELAGFYEYLPEGDAIIIGLGLRPDWTGRGLGLGFVRSGLEFARHTFHPESFRLRVGVFNRRAIKVYERAGFEPDGTEWFTLFNREYEFLWMKRKANKKPGV